MKSLLLTILLAIAVATSALATGERIGWDAITDPSVTNVRVYQATSTNGPWTLIKTVGVPLNTVDCAITAPGTYWWYLTAINSYAESAPTKVLTEVFTASDFPPATPANAQNTKYH